ncbi:carbohydrate kinase [Ralstonia solanacearum]|uniref:bifunctional ADP-dependent NAD(P)H-hydrate dehydratase/NAD(P)H-hydrate epimerase n=1 Tax=Ralstonia solanacearum TaxID=305 RepID=UPI0007D7A35C|nr:bifunctional ADP-dependent NAD(P)H-hydrate dehydratase/NAD(P)H-hydrate epimerase [Ralstonia solanacearum]OAI63623.1 carbohydrate kinase [Ralstonia solanacearum]
MSAHSTWRDVLRDGAPTERHGADLLFGSAAVRALETAAGRALAPFTLMARAGEAAADWLQARAPRGHLLLVAGPGNNGGDALVVATALHEAGRTVTVWLAADPARLPDDARRAWTEACAANVPIEILHAPASVPATVTAIVDGLFGIGLTRPLTGLHAALVETLNGSGLPVYALDVPSGLSGDTGQPPAPDSPVVRAHATLTFLAAKPGLFTGMGRDAAGDLALADLQAAQPAYDGIVEADAQINTPLRWLAHIPRRRHNGHKGTYGSVAIVGGAQGMVGAPLLSARGALYLGAGKVHVVSLAADAPHVDCAQPELMLHTWGALDLGGMQALAAGPGMGTGKDAYAALDHLLDRMLPGRIAAVFDADALNLFARAPALLTRLTRLASGGAPIVLTPHPLEAARLLDTDAQTVQRDRLAAAQALVNRCGAVVVLKGSGTVIAAPGVPPTVNPTGNGGLASGGTGDVLTGMVGALLAQGVPAREAALAAVWLHGRAADELVAAGEGPIGLHAGELCLPARRALNGLLKSDACQ